MNNMNPTTGINLPQLVTHPSGQVFMIAAHPQSQIGVPYFVQRPFLGTSHAMHQSPITIQQSPTTAGRFLTPQSAQSLFSAQQPQQLQLQPQQHQQPQQQQQIQQQQQRPQQHQQLQLQHPQQHQQQFQLLQVHHQPQSQTPSQHATSNPTKRPRASSPRPRALEQTIAKLKNGKQKYISHYIDGQLIIETSNPVIEKKYKSNKKRRRSQGDGHLELAQSEGLNSTSQQDQISQSNETQTLTSEANTNDVKSLRESMKKWSVAAVVDFIEQHEDIRQYASKFAEDEVDGKALLLMIDRNLNLQMLASMFKHGPAMKIEAVLSKYKSDESS